MIIKNPIIHLNLSTIKSAYNIKTISIYYLIMKEVNYNPRKIRDKVHTKLKQINNQYQQ